MVPAPGHSSIVEFEILGDIENIEKIAVKTSIRDLSQLRKIVR